jgi:hypothetical protein
VDDRACGGRRLLAPHGVDQAVLRDELVRVQEQVGEQGALFRAAELRSRDPLHFELAQEPKRAHRQGIFSAFFANF